MSYSSFKKNFNFAGSGRVISSHLADRAKQGAIDPISMLNDYLNTVFDDLVTCSLCRSCRNTALPRYPQEKPQLAAILSLHVERLSFKKLIILFCRLPMK